MNIPPKKRWMDIRGVNKNKRIYFLNTNTNQANYQHYVNTPEGRVRYKGSDDNLAPWQLRVKRMLEDNVA